MARISPARIPADVTALCRSLVNAGYSAFVVGGAVRDLLLYDASLGMQAKDFDVATSAHPEDVVRIFGKRRTIPTGIAHGTVTVLCDRLPAAAHGGEPDDGELGSSEHKHRHVEVTTFRGETGYSDGRRPDRIEFIADLVEDLRRRDFTINAIAYDPLTDTLHDPFLGQGDLKRGLLRAVGDPSQRFAEDGLRLLRAVRFAAKLNFQIEPLTRRAFAPALPTLRKVSRERVRDELLRLLSAAHPDIGLKHLFEPTLELDQVPLPSHFDAEQSLLSVALPEVCAVLGGSGLAAQRWVQLVIDCPLSLRPAALLWPLRQACMDPRSALPKDPRRLSSLLDDRLKLPLAQRNHLTALLLMPEIEYDAAAPWPAPQVRRLLASQPAALTCDWLALRERALRIEQTTVRADHLQTLRERIAELQSQAPPLSIAELAITGQDVLSHFRLPPGPRVGQVLRHLLEQVLDDPRRNEREYLLAEAARVLGLTGD